MATTQSVQCFGKKKTGEFYRIQFRFGKGKTVLANDIQ